MRVLIVDGHSMIFAWPEILKMHQRRTAQGREAVVKLLTEYHDASGDHVIVVFDGKGAKWTETTEPGGIQVFYSGANQTADDLIERLVAKYGKTNEITVATSDHLEQQTVISFGANAIPAESLRGLLEQARTDLDRRLKQHRRR